MSLKDEIKLIKVILKLLAFDNDFEIDEQSSRKSY